MKNITLYILLFACTTVFSQKTNHLQERKGKLFFSVGTEYRITPIWSVKNAEVSFNGTNMDLQNSGMALNLSLDYFVTKNFSLGFTNSVRYDLIIYPYQEIENDFGFKKTENDFIFGFHFYADYHFKIFKNSELFVRLGRSLLNRGTDFTSKETFYDNEGNTILSNYNQENFAYEPWNYAIGYKKDKINLIIGMYGSNISEYFDNDATFLVPYISFKYTIGKL